MRKKCFVCLYLNKKFSTFKLRPFLNFRMIVSLGPEGKLKGLQVTIRSLSGLQCWTTELKVASSFPSRGRKTLSVDPAVNGTLFRIREEQRQ